MYYERFNVKKTHSKGLCDWILEIESEIFACEKYTINENIKKGVK